MRSLKRQVAGGPRQTTDDQRTSCDGLLINGVDAQAAWRTHLRAQTTARQALEQQAGSRAGDTRDEAEERETYRREALAEIAEQHLAWLRAHNPRPEQSVEAETWIAAEPHRPRTTRSRRAARRPESLATTPWGPDTCDDQATEVSGANSR